MRGERFPADSVVSCKGWSDLTTERLSRLGLKWPIVLCHGWSWSGTFDLVFVDGVDGLRRNFALRAWPLLKVGGYLLFHETRRAQDVSNLTALIATFSSEIESVHMNQDGSNISVVTKKPPQPYSNWQEVEGLPSWR
jgi:hypothetical protein